MLAVKNGYDSAVGLLSEHLCDLLVSVPESMKPCVAEIRLRAQKPIMLTVNNAPLWINDDGVHYLPPPQPYIITKAQLCDTYMKLCENSVYSHEEELRQGFIVLRHGHRAGVCGTKTQSGMIRDVSSINVRIARQVIGCASDALCEFDGQGMLIAGPPASGKTTLLRDLIRQLSMKKFLRIAVVDTRGELAASYCGVPANSLGDTVDVLNGYEKAEGIEIAVRTLNPQVVAVDELGERDVAAVSTALNCGAALIATVHVGNERELFSNRKVKMLLKTGAISKIILMSANVCGKFKIIKEW